MFINPGIFKQAKISPLVMLFPNFRLGAFKPGLLGSGMKNL